MLFYNYNPYVYISLFISYSNVNEVSYFKDIDNCVTKGLLICSLNMAL